MNDRPRSASALADHPAPPSVTRFAAIAFATMVLSALVAWGGSYALSSESPTRHLGRVIGVVAPIAVAVLTVFAPYGERPRVLARGVVVLGCLGVTVAAWWFVPTRGGLNLFTAMDRATYLREQFQVLPGDAVKQPVELIEEGGAIATDFPGKTYIWRESLESWQTKSSDQFLRMLEGISLGDLTEYERSSWQRARLMAACPQTVSEITSAEREWLQATSLACVKEVKGRRMSRKQPRNDFKSFLRSLRPSPCRTLQKTVWGKQSVRCCRRR